MKKGFTLVELLVVVVIIGILLAIILPNAVRAIREANTKQCASNIRSIDTAVRMFYSRTRTWPSDVDDLAPELEEEAVPVCPFGVDYTLIDTDADGNLDSCDRSTHFTVWPDQHL